jgi:hypothetical protein
MKVATMAMQNVRFVLSNQLSEIHRAVGHDDFIEALFHAFGQQFNVLRYQIISF